MSLQSDANAALADPTNQEAAERIKFATQLSPEWVIVEQDKLAKVLDNQGASASETLEALASGDFEFDISDEAGEQESADVSAEVEEHSPGVLRALRERLDPLGVPITLIPHTDFKLRTHDARAFVRSGEFTPYANVILQAGVAY